MANIPPFRAFLPTFPVEEGQEFNVGLTRVDSSRFYENIPVTISLVTNGFNGEATGADIIGNSVIQTVIPAGEPTIWFPIKTLKDNLFEGPETLTLYATETGDERFSEYYAVEIKDKPQQNITITPLDKELTFTEGESVTLRYAISGNVAGTSENVQIPTNTWLGEGGNAGSQLKFYTSSQSEIYRWFMPPLTPGQTYAEVTIKSLEDSLRENDAEDTVGGNWTQNMYTQNGYETTIAFKGATKVTLLDDDWAPTQSPSVVINGDNNIVNQNTYYDNRTYVNSFNQTYVNSFNGTAGRDTLTGTTQNDQLAGLNGNDILRGAQGNDSVIGGKGNDQLFGGLGLNTLDGGAGRDIYNVAAETNAAQADILKNFTGADRINIIGGANLTFQSMQDGIGIFNNGTLQALATGNVTLDAVRNATSAI